MVAAAIRLALGEEPDLTPQHAPQGAAIRYIMPRPGRVASVSGVEQARSCPGVRIVDVYVGPGDEVVAVTSSGCRSGEVELHFIGTTGAAVRTLKAEVEARQVAVFEHPQQPFDQLGELFDRLQIDLGVVLLADAAAGVVSPCKYTGYIQHGLPALYIGPPETNADAVVSRFGAGFALRNSNNNTEVVALAAQIWDNAGLTAAAERVPLAARHFAQFSGRSLAAVFGQWLPSGNRTR